MTTVALLSLVERAGGVLSIRDDRVFCDIPEDAAQYLPELRQRRGDVLRLLQQRLADVRQWIAAQCVASSRCASNPTIMHREFIAWSGLECSQQAFVSELERCGFELDRNGMICGLLLGVDFVAAREYERSRCA